MAGIASKGSQRDFNYVADDGTVWGLRLDESNTELVNLSANTGAATATHRLPSNITPRRAYVQDITGEIKRECTVLTLARFTALSGSTDLELSGQDSNDTTDVRVFRKVPERETRLIKNFDTGLTDGDNP